MIPFLALLTAGEALAIATSAAISTVASMAAADAYNETTGSSRCSREDEEDDE